MSVVRRLVVVLVTLLVVPSVARAQAPGQTPPAAENDSIDTVDDVLVPLVGGGIAGLALAVALVQPHVDALPKHDETTVAVAIPAGIVLAVLTRLTARTRLPGRLRATMGTTTAHTWEYGLTYRTSLTQHVAVDAALIVGNDSWEDIERMTRCSLLGCYTGDFIVAGRYEQMVSAVARAVYEPFPSSKFRPSIAVGGGPSRMFTEHLYSTTAARTGALLDVMLGVERAWLTADLGLRVGTMDAESSVDGAVYVRVGYTMGAHP